MRLRRGRLLGRWLCTVALVLLTAWWVVSGWCSVACWTSNHCVRVTMGTVVWASGPLVAQPPGAGVAVDRVTKPLDVSRWSWRPYYARYKSLGLRVGAGRTVMLSSPSIVSVPMWPAVLVLGTASFWFWRAEVRERAAHRKKWCCTSCGYDRRGLAADAKCPECGAVAAPAAK